LPAIIAPLIGLGFEAIGAGAFGAAAIAGTTLTVSSIAASVVFVGAVFGAELLLSRPKAQQPSLKLPQSPVAIEAEVQPTADRFYSYGRNRAGGVFVFREATGNYLGFGIVLNCRPIDGLDTWIIDDETWTTSTGATNIEKAAAGGTYPQAVSFSSNVFWPTAGQKVGNFVKLVYSASAGAGPVPSGSGVYMMSEFRNATDAGFLSELLSSSLFGFQTLWDSTHLARGLSMIYAVASAGWAQYHQAHFPNWLPKISAVYRGAAVYDPRDLTQTFYTTGTTYSVYNTTWRFTQNPVLQIADFLTFPEGFGLSYDDIDWKSFKIAADYCDRTVAIFGGGTESFAQSNLTWTAGQERREVLSDLLATCDGMLWEGADGKINIWIGQWLAPTVTLTDADLAFPIQFDQLNSVYAAENHVIATYIEPRMNYVRNSAPPAMDTASIASVGARKSSLELKGVQSPHQAYRLANRALRRKNTPLRITCRTGPRGLLADGEIVVGVNSATYGVNGTFRVMSMQIDDLATVSIVLHQVTTSMYDDVVAPYDAVNPALPVLQFTGSYIPPAPVFASLSSTPTVAGAEILATMYAPGQTTTGGATNGDSVSYARFRYQSVASIDAPAVEASWIDFTSYSSQYSGIGPAIPGTNGVSQVFAVVGYYVSGTSQASPYSAVKYITITTFH
jgi:hypothetical protein